MKWLLFFTLLLTILTSFRLPVKTHYTAEFNTIPTIKALSLQSEKDIKLLATLCMSEAALQNDTGKLAVMQVVMNRVKSDLFPNTVQSVIYQKGQFDGIHTKHFKSDTTQVFKHTFQLAKKIYFSEVKVVPSTTLFYFNPKISTDKKFIKWCSKFNYIIIQDHKFIFI